ncbi:MAG: hypothetical protein F4203_00780 [Rhodobacteraceae bacterium]|nr:hypothetical protein [Paracoccaceae bacterium]
MPNGKSGDTGVQVVYVGGDTDAVHARSHQELGKLLSAAFRTPAEYILGGPPQRTVTGQTCVEFAYAGFSGSKKYRNRNHGG